ncbi:MAG: PD-(D/E)XK nuclease family protein [Elusimicrobiota bacterium]|jgi:RecB family exonuclease
MLISEIGEWLRENPAPRRPSRVYPAGTQAPAGLSGMEISYSQMRSYLDCPWLYKLVYRDRKRPLHHPASSLGVSIHRALESYHRAGGGELSVLLEAYDQHWSHTGFSTPQEQLQWHAKGRTMLERFHAEESARKSEILAVEKELLAPLDPHILRGTADRIDRRPDGSIEVIDYKTHMDVQEEDQTAQSLQLGLYGLLVEECLGQQVSWLTFYYVAAGKRVSVPREPSQDELLREFVLRMADILCWGKSFTPQTGHCPACDARAFCPHAPKT